MLWPAGGAWAGEATGTLYFLEAGSGGGTIHLYSGGRLIRLHFLNGYREAGFGQGRAGYRYGAIWSVHWHDGVVGPELDRASFDGQYDEDVKAADELVRRHYKLLAIQDYGAAWRDLSDGWHASQTFDEFAAGFREARFKPEATDPPSFALKIIGQNKSEVLVLANHLWLMSREDHYFRYLVIRTPTGWKIDRVDPITPQQWEDS